MSEAPAIPYRWTLDEYVLRCALGADVRELLVEGELDLDFFAAVLERNRMNEVAIFDADYVEISDETVREAGYATGAKGRLLTIAAALNAEVERNGTLSGTVVILVDHNFDSVPDDLSRFVVSTDGYSVENYSLTERSIESFIRLLLGRLAAPVGARGARRQRRTTVSGSDLLRRLIPPSIEVTAARRVLSLSYPGVGLIDGWIGYFKVDKDGDIASDALNLLRNSVVSASGDASAIDPATLATERAKVGEQPRTLIRGRDYIALFHKLLKSRWGRQVSGFNFAKVEEHHFRRWVVLATVPDDIDSEPVVAELVTRFA